eukprot:CAMPEP_0179443244 /NCGR_PEP_ID=MMETSP0799-20121207/26658_1 /TAXON_ID=46947 /ORGANISM="Geminigera cryophila, Strain CCMP2564" /LENGTH=190 /DNA_ID=CAMNT_0021229029 /DNA_START=121 /DNA_END=690 /DNA_ORIENTATION=-
MSSHDDEASARRRPITSDAHLGDGEHDSYQELQEAASAGGLRPAAGGRRQEYKRHAYASNHALFTGRARKPNSAVVNRQRKWGLYITGALVAFVYCASYGLGQNNDGSRRNMHTDGKFMAPIGYSTKGLDFRKAYLQREEDNSHIIHEMHERKKKEAQQDAAHTAQGGSTHIITTTAPSTAHIAPSISAT